MKKRTRPSGINIFLFSGILILSLSACGQKKQDKSPDDSVTRTSTKVSSGSDNFPVFEVKEHNFGEIARGEEVGARFRFENAGESPLVVERVSTGCGCTVAEYTREPVLQGESGFVEVAFDSSGRSGRQFQEASVFFKGLKQPVRLSVVAQVVKK